MRKKERIPVVLEFFKNNEKAFNEFTLTEKNFHDFINKFSDIEEKWLEYPDLRFGQLLINMGIIPDNSSLHKEEDQWLINHNYINIEDIMTWTSYFNKEGEKLKQSKTVFLKDLTDDHIENIINFVDVKKLYPGYENYFRKRLNER